MVGGHEFPGRWPGLYSGSLSGCKCPGLAGVVRPPFRQMAPENDKNLRFPRAPDPVTPFVLAAGGGWRTAKTLERYAFLAFRQWLALAGGQLHAARFLK
jgi:hypothetical protein